MKTVSACFNRWLLYTDYFYYHFNVLLHLFLTLKAPVPFVIAWSDQSSYRFGRAWGWVKSDRIFTFLGQLFLWKDRIIINRAKRVLERQWNEWRGWKRPDRERTKEAEKESANRIVLIVQFLAVHSLRLRESYRREEYGDSQTLKLI